jgi:hypothetical protein
MYGHGNQHLSYFHVSVPSNVLNGRHHSYEAGRRNHCAYETIADLPTENQYEKQRKRAYHPDKEDHQWLSFQIWQGF